MRRTAASEKGAVGTAGEENRALPARSRLRLGAPGIGLGGPGAERRAIVGEGTGAASGIARAAEGRADIHQRLSEIARPAAWRQRARRRGEFASCAGDRLFQSKKPRQNAGDIAIDRRCLATKGDRRDRGRGIGANARKRAQARLPRSEMSRLVERFPWRRRADFALANNSRDPRTRS